MNFWQEFLINNAITVLLQSVKNPQSQAQFKRAFLKVRNTINMMYAGDPDFQ